MILEYKPMSVLWPGGQFASKGLLGNGELFFLVCTRDAFEDGVGGVDGLIYLGISGGASWVLWEARERFLEGGNVLGEGGKGSVGCKGHGLSMLFEKLNELVGLSYSFGWLPGESPVSGGGGRGANLDEGLLCQVEVLHQSVGQAV